MKYYSTNQKSPEVSLREAVVKGLAPDGGLYMPQSLCRLPQEFFESIHLMPFNDIAKIVASSFFGDDIEKEALDEIVDDTLQFDCPVRQLTDSICSLELFNGPTLAFKDVGGRFMARLLRYFIRKEHAEDVNVLVATSGDTGSAVANGFLGVDGIHVYVLYPKGKVSKIQECQFTTLGRNITAIEVDGVFDDCQALVKRAFVDKDLNSKLKLTSANSINVARFLPQAFYYFNAYARMKAAGLAGDMVVSVPSGNFGNITAGLFARAMGLPIKRFIAANNKNDVFYEYLKTGVYSPRPSIQTIANAMDVGNPSNFARILDMYGNDVDAIRAVVSGASYDDRQIFSAMADCYESTGYVLDPHGACGYLALVDGLQDGEHGVFLETAHPAKFRDTVESAIHAEVLLPERLSAFLRGKKESVEMKADFSEFKSFLMTSQK